MPTEQRSWMMDLSTGSCHVNKKCHHCNRNKIQLTDCKNTEKKYQSVPGEQQHVPVRKVTEVI